MEHPGSLGSGRPWTQEKAWHGRPNERHTPARQAAQVRLPFRERLHAEPWQHALAVQPVLACASDFGWHWVNRPRLCGGCRSTGHPRLKTLEGWRRNPERPSLTWTTLKGVALGRLSMPTATTPAADEWTPSAEVLHKNPSGRPWLADSRQFAPWHYKKEAMKHDDTGRLTIPPAKVKD